MMKLAERLINEKEYQRQKKKVISGKLFFFLSFVGDWARMWLSFD